MVLESLWIGGWVGGWRFPYLWVAFEEGMDACVSSHLRPQVHLRFSQDVLGRDLGGWVGGWVDEALSHPSLLARGRIKVYPPTHSNYPPTARCSGTFWRKLTTSKSLSVSGRWRRVSPLCISSGRVRG